MNHGGQAYIYTVGHESNRSSQLSGSKLELSALHSLDILFLTGASCFTELNCLNLPWLAAKTEGSDTPLKTRTLRAKNEVLRNVT